MDLDLDYMWSILEPSIHSVGKNCQKIFDLRTGALSSFLKFTNNRQRFAWTFNTHFWPI